jgi:hypothetical protein
MKRYTKTIDGRQVVKPANKIIINKDGMNTFNPTEEMILADGWVEYVELIYEETEEERLKRTKDRIIERITRYDSSVGVNIFYIGDYGLWLDKATRVGLKLRFDAELESGKTITTLWNEGIPFELELVNAIHMLNTIEMYASACYDNTQKHIANVKKLDNIEDIEHYDYRTGYPEKIRF